MGVFRKGLVGLLVAGLCWSPALAGEITVSAAASLSNAFTEMKAAFEKVHPDVVVRTNFAASNPLLRQIREGAPVAVFASADQKTMNEAMDFVVPGSRVDFAANSLVLITPSDMATVNTVSDLDGAGVKRLAVGSPESVPAGRYARDALADRWAALGDKLVFGNSVRQVLDYVAKGEVDAGIVYRSDTLAVPGKVRIAAELTGHAPIVYPMARIKPDNAEAKTFMDFVQSKQGREILARHGFSSPEK